MCRLLLISLLFTPWLSLEAQDSCDPVKEQIVRTLSKSPKVMSNDTYYYAQNEFTISLVGDFQDSINIYVGNNLIFHGYVIADGSPGHPRINIRIPFKNKSEQPVMKIFFVNKNLCLTEILVLTSPILEVRASNRWYLTYTNHFASLE